MKKVFLMVLIVVVIFSLCSCITKSKATCNYNDINQEISKDTYINYDIAQEVLKDRSENFNYSPLSLYYALALLETGAKGETQQQILEVLGSSTSEEVAIKYSEIYKSLYADNEINKFKIANSLWLNSDIEFKNDFLLNIDNSLNAEAFSVDFSDKSTNKKMADWISKNTNGTLVASDLEVKPKQILSIINTVYFCDEWKESFNKQLTEKDIFHAEQNDVMVDFMNKNVSSCEFAKGKKYTRASLELKNNEDMIFILPDKGVSIGDLMSSKNALQGLFEDGQVHVGEVVWKIPKFAFNTKCNLTSVLESSGIKDAFNSNADFSRMTNAEAFVSDIRQETYINIDENGVEASAFTQIDSFGAIKQDKSATEKAEMILNRPFIYGIVSSEGILIFVGVCNNPAL